MAYINKAKTVEWATPTALFRELDKEFNFNLDVASTDENAKCERHFTQRENGLIQNWGGQEFTAIHHTADASKIGLERLIRRKTMPRS